MKKLLSVMLAVIMAVTVIPAAYAAGSETVILYTNDVHCAIDDYPVIAAYKADLIAQGKNVVVVDAGDAIQGEVIGALTEGEAIVDIMNAVGYDYAVPGNHEFDYGMDVFLDLAQNKAEYEYICSNFYDLTTITCIFSPYSIEDFGAYQIAFVGISTPETITKSTPEFFKDESGNFIYGFPAYPGGLTNDEFYDSVQQSVDDAIDDGADIVVAVGHTGELETTDGWKTSDIIANTSGIDYFIDAHSHETVEQEIYKNLLGEDVIRTSTGTKLASFGALTISGGEADFELINPDEVDIDTMSAQAQTAYDTVKEKVDGYNEEIAHLFEEIGTSEAKLVTYEEDKSWAVRKRETNAGDFVADAYRAVTGADVAVANGGGVRGEIEIGGVSRKMLMDMNPFGNDMCVLEVTGQQLVDMLEHGARECPDSLGSFFQVSGVRFEIHTYNESPVNCDMLGNFVGIDEAMVRRVQNVCVGDEPVDLNKTYTLVGSQYVLTQGGDGLTMLDGAKIVQQEGLPCDNEMLIEYFTDTLNGVIPADKYGNPNGDGRIKLVDTHTHKFDEDDKCICGAKKADYSGYDEAYARFRQMLADNDLNDTAMEFLREKQQEIIDEHLNGGWLKNNYSEDEQYILDNLEDAFNEMCDELEAGIADGTYIKPDFTEIEAKIEQFEKTHTDDKYKDLIATVKAELEAIKNSDLDSAAAVADKIAALEEKMNNADACDHMCHNAQGFIGFIWKIAIFIFRLLNIQQYCDCGELHYDAPFFG